MAKVIVQMRALQKSGDVLFRNHSFGCDETATYWTRVSNSAAIGAVGGNPKPRNGRQE